MATPRRRSSRINSNGTPSRSAITPAASKLSSLLERDESPPSGTPPNIDALVSSPVPPPNTTADQSRFDTNSLPLKTPQTASRTHVSLEEMHPSKVHQSTIKPSPSLKGLDNIAARLSASPSKSNIARLSQNTPSKRNGALPSHMNSPTFDFSFERPESDLSLEAQKIMDSVRDEAAKIKAQMMQERGKQEYKDGETDQLFGVGGRKINKAKGKSGRYSNVHRQEFKKMDSIAGHVSAWKNNMKANTLSLKRSPSKAGLDQPAKPLARTKSYKAFDFNDCQERLENTAPGKRVKQKHSDDTSNGRRVSRDSNKGTDSTRTTPGRLRPDSNLPSAVTTPTKASLARSTSVKNMKTSMIPSLSRSATTLNLNSPARPKTEGSNKYLASLSRFGSMKSILHRPQPKFSDDPIKVAAGTHLPVPVGTIDHSKELPSLPGSFPNGGQSTPTIKRVDFAPQSTPPSKISTPITEKGPEVSVSPPFNIDSVRYPDLGNSLNITTRTKIPKAFTPGDFTFRTEKTISFSPSKETVVASPSSTIRHVRPSGVPTHVPSFESIPAFPHGIPNKKRNRPDSDTPAGDEENVDPMDNQVEDEDAPRAKKQRVEDLHEQKTVNATSPLKRRVAGAGESRIPKFGDEKGKGRMGLTLGRLNVLASPKKRR